jgi:putative hydrolase
MSAIDRGKRFSIPAKDLLRYIPLWECHIHTHYADGTSTIRQVVDWAIEFGLTRIIFTEHTEPWHTSWEDWFSKYVADILLARKEYGDQLEILIGIEAPATDFEHGLGITPEMMKIVDFILGTAHRYPHLKGRSVKDLKRDEIIDYEYRTLMALAANPHIDAIAHIGGTCKRYCCPFPEELTRQVIRTATLHGIAIEINHQYHTPLYGFVNLCIEEDAIVTLGSDAHRVEEVGSVVSALREISLRN